MAPKFIILFNGPPRTGKDTVSEFLLKELQGSVIIKFTKPVKDMTHKKYNLDVEHDYYEDLKDTHLIEFQGKTPRESYIETSTNLREKEGNNAVAKLFVKEVLESTADIVINPDIGYDFEAEELFNSFDISNILLFKINREGKSFEHDCRDWLTVDTKYENLKTYNVFNDNKEEFISEVADYVRDFLVQNSNALIY